jgi:hypothetical protein
MTENLSAIPDATMVSRSGTRHIVGPQSSRLHTGRISALCGFGVPPEDGPFEALRDCMFCVKAAAELERKEEPAEAPLQLDLAPHNQPPGGDSAGEERNTEWQ